MRYFLCIFLFLPIIVCSQNNDNTLFKAYENQSDSVLINFLDAWHNDYPQANTKRITKMNRYLREAYRVYYDIYSKVVIDSLKKHDILLFVQDSTKYALVQSDIKIYKCKKIEGNLLYNEKLIFDIKNFRPDINNKKVLVNTQKYNQLLEAFLNTENQYAEKETKQERIKRIDFLKRYVSFSYPKINHIIFDEKLQFASLTIYASQYITYEIILRKYSNKWIYYAYGKIIE